MDAPWKLLVNRHQVIGLTPRFGKALTKEIIERSQIFQLPVLSCAHFTQVATQLHEARVLFLLDRAFPAQNLIHLPQDEQTPAPIQLRFRENPSVSRQMRPANQDRLLLGGASAVNRSSAGLPSTIPDEGSPHSRYLETGCRHALGIGRIRSDALFLPPDGHSHAIALR